MTAYSKLAMEQLQSKKPAVSPILLRKMYCMKCEVNFATQVAKRSHLCEAHDRPDMSRYRILKTPLFGRFFLTHPSRYRYRFFKTSPLFLELPLFITAKVLYFDKSLLHHWLSLSLSGCFRFRNSMSSAS